MTRHSSEDSTFVFLSVWQITSLLIRGIVSNLVSLLKLVRKFEEIEARRSSALNFTKLLCRKVHRKRKSKQSGEEVNKNME